MFDNGRWRINAYRNINTNQPSLMLENLMTGFTDWPIRYDDGRIAYDFPERIPAYVKRITKAIFSQSNNQWASLTDAEFAGVV